MEKKVAEKKAKREVWCYIIKMVFSNKEDANLAAPFYFNPVTHDVVLNKVFKELKQSKLMKGTSKLKNEVISFNVLAKGIEPSKMHEYAYNALDTLAEVCSSSNSVKLLVTKKYKPTEAINRKIVEVEPEPEYAIIRVNCKNKIRLAEVKELMRLDASEQVTDNIFADLFSEVTTNDIIKKNSTSINKNIIEFSIDLKFLDAIVPILACNYKGCPITGFHLNLYSKEVDIQFKAFVDKNLDSVNYTCDSII